MSRRVLISAKHHRIIDGEVQLIRWNILDAATRLESARVRSRYGRTRAPGPDPLSGTRSTFSPNSTGP